MSIDPSSRTVASAARPWLFALLVLAVGPTAWAQEAGSESPAEEDVEAEGLDDDGYEEEEDEYEEDDEPRLERPAFERLQLSTGDDEGELDESEEEEDGLDEEDEAEDPDEAPSDDDLPSPAEAQATLDDDGGATFDPTVTRWTTPQTVFDLHGYFRFRGEFQDNFFFNRVLDDPANIPGAGPLNGPGQTALPFALFRPAEDGRIDAGCVDGDGNAVHCDQNALAYANIRLRMEPTIHLSDDVRIRMQLDLLDNVVLGSTPNSLSVGPQLVLNSAGERVLNPYARYSRGTFAPFELASSSIEPPRSGINSVQDSIIVRRAWAEVRNRGLGELRFGRMGNHWGLGMVHNGGAGLDSDYQTDVDRIMLITRLAGIYIFGAWDFGSEGLLYQEIPDLGGVPFDRSRIDDVDQFFLGAAYRRTPEEAEEMLQRGDAVFNIGASLQFRTQNLSSFGTGDPLNLCVAGLPSGTDESGIPGGNTICGQGDPDFDRFGTFDVDFIRRNATVFVPDLWMQFLFGDLRLELEAAMVVGSIDNLEINDGDSELENVSLVQFGLAFEAEYHLLDDALGIYFNAGYASGDPDAEGLTQVGGLLPQRGDDSNTISTFFMHPNYRVDLILWRTVMRQVGGAYYFRPGISYDFLRSSFGQRLGARADVIWSRASERVQAYGNASDLAIEVDASLYYRSEDGPDLLDGFYASIQYGILFPLDGLGYLSGQSGVVPNLGNAQTIRGILGVVY
jgi:hypothetical protein